MQMNDSIKHPKCFYHPQQNIISICLHSQCILPLCQLCLCIHRQQFSSGEHISKNIPLKQAKNIAISAISLQQQNLLKESKQFNLKFHQFRKNIINSVEKALDELEDKLNEQKYNFKPIITDFQQRIQKIKVNNLKQLIKHYENGSIYTGTITKFQYKINNELINNLLIDSLCLQLQSKFENKQTETDRKIENSILNNSAVESVVNQTPHLGKMQNNSSPTVLKNSVNLEQTISTKRKSTRLGIFVASSPHHIKKLGRFNSTQVKPLRNLSENDLIIEESTSKLYQSGLKIKSEANPATPMPRKNNILITERPQSQKNHQFLYNNSVTIPKKVLINRQNSSSKKRLQLGSKTQQKSKNWKDVVNKFDIASNSSSSRLIIRRNEDSNIDCMNPQQMRELIMKKRGYKVSQSAVSNTEKLTIQKL